MTALSEMRTLRHPDPEKSGPRMNRFKFDTYREAILAAIPKGDEGIAFKVLPDRVREQLPKDKLDQLGKVTWHVVSVKLHLEAEGLLERVPGMKQQYLRHTR